MSSVVIESENNIVLDFSTKIEDGDLGSEINEDDLSSTPVTARSDASSTSLLTKVIKVCSFFLVNTILDGHLLLEMQDTHFEA